jgi:dihydroorotase
MDKQGIIIYNAKIFTEKNTFRGSLRIEDELIAEIFKGEVPETILQKNQVIDASDLWLLPGVIDSHVHFRDPGLTDKANIATESKAALAGGVTSFIDMPNTIPPTTTMAAWETKQQIAAEKSLINYGFFLGATPDNLNELLQADPHKIPGIKMYLGSTTGNLVIDKNIAQQLMSSSQHLLVAHAEDDLVIQRNSAIYREQFGEDVPFSYHPMIRSTEACYKTTASLVEMAMRNQSRLHIAHVSTANELALFDGSKPLAEKQITAEACIPYLWFDQRDYDRLGAKIKSNPAIKTENDKKALLQALTTNKIDTIATDHAPHLLSEKTGSYFYTPSGIPSIQYSLPLMLELVRHGQVSIEKMIEKMCYAPATLFRIHRRGFIRKGFFADLVLVNPNNTWTITPESTLSKCGWSPYEDVSLHAKVTHTFVNGVLQFENDKVTNNQKGQALSFNIK